MGSVNAGRWHRGRMNTELWFCIPRIAGKSTCGGPFLDDFPAKMIKKVKFCSVFPANEGCGGLGVFFFFSVVFNSIALLLFYTFVGTLEICIWFHPFFLG